MASNINIKLHYHQRDLVRKLSLGQGIRFNDLLIEELGSEHMNYHLKKIISLGLVKKNKGLYYLTDAGKDYSNLTDEETDLIEKQPKTSIVIHAVRHRAGVVEHLLTRRLRQPYYGKVGRITGKVRFGETFEQAAQREFYEETGLTAKRFFLEEIYHKLRKRPSGEWVQDVIFYIFFVTGTQGKLITHTPYQENFWISKPDFEREKPDAYDDLEMDNRTLPKKFSYRESVGIAKGF